MSGERAQAVAEKAERATHEQSPIQGGRVLTEDQTSVTPLLQEPRAQVPLKDALQEVRRHRRRRRSRRSRRKTERGRKLNRDD